MRYAFPPAMLLVLLLTAGCKRTINSVNVAMGNSAETITTRRSHDDPLLFRVTVPLNIDVESFGGDVVIVAKPGREHASVKLTRRGTHGVSRGKEADAAMLEIENFVDVVPGELGPTLVIRTSTTNPEAHFLRADIRIEVPDVDSIRVHTTRGDVKLHHVKGRVDVRTSDGRVIVRTERPMTEPVQIINDAGSIEYRVRRESTGVFDCAAVRGTVVQNAQYGDVVVHDGTSFDALRSTLNNGTNPVLMRAADGDIRIAVVDDPENVMLLLFD